MKTVKLKICANYCMWASWPEKIANLKQFFSSKIDLKVDLVHTSFPYIPFVRYSADNLSNGDGIEKGWFKANVNPLGQGYDIVLFVCNTNQWLLTNTALGWRIDDGGLIETMLGADENETMAWLNGRIMSTFHAEATHEILHALFTICGRPDSTHYWYDRGLVENALNDIIFPVDNSKELDELRLKVAEATTLVARLVAMFKRLFG